MTKKQQKKNHSLIQVVGAREHNLKEVDLEIPKQSLVAFSGVSGSGKSSLAFETLYKEGQRRYLGAISTHSAEEPIAKPLVDSITGLSATVAIQQKSVQRQPRSLVGTLTQCYDLCRVLWAHEAVPICPTTGKSLQPQSAEEITKKILERLEALSLKNNHSVLYLCARIAEHKKGSLQDLRQQWLKAGFTRAFIDNALEQLTSDSWNLDPKKGHTFDLVIDRYKLEPNKLPALSRLRESVERALEVGQGHLLSRVDEQCWSDSTLGGSGDGSIATKALTPSDFSFNSPQGMCPKCQGLGYSRDWILEKVIDQDKALDEQALRIVFGPLPKRLQTILHSIGLLHGFSLKTPWKEISKEGQEVILNGYNPPWVTMRLVNPRTGRGFTDRILWKGVLGEAWQRYQGYTSAFAKKKMEPFLTSGICSACEGSRLAPYPSSAQLFGKTIAEFTAMSAKQALLWLSEQPRSAQTEKRVGPVIERLIERLSCMVELGLDYLTLDRGAATLSGGEAQRVRLCAHLGAGLTGVIYVLDEPSIGLHARDNEKLIQTLKRLRDRGNTVVVVEHDEETLLQADHIVDFGPGAGDEGGEVVYSGPIHQFLNQTDRSLTAQYLVKKAPLHREPLSQDTEKSSQIHIQGGSCHNIKNLNLSIPLKKLVGITGVSGSGKSTLMHRVLAHSLTLQREGQSPVAAKNILLDEKIDQVIAIDQTPIGRLPRSNPATYVKVFDEIRDLFTKLPLSRERGYSAGRFSFNVSEGSCGLCQGMGYQKIDMDFMADEYVLCRRCSGKRFDESTLDVCYRGLNIHQVLELTISKALEHFCEIPPIAKKLKVLEAIGLGYLPLGHPSPYLSGGEAQRIKLAKELMRPARGHILYLLDEPTTGLHMHDVQKLVNLLSSLVDRGHSVLVIEHHLDFLSCCDFLLEMGPEGGDLGGKCIVRGSCNDLIKAKSPTGKALASLQKYRSDALWKKYLTPKELSNKKIEKKQISILGAQQNNLRSIDLQFEQNKMHLITGVSGAGKSSLLQKTLYSYGIRQYSETLSPYARQFLSLPPEPKVESVEGLGPCVLVHGEHHSHNPRSTLGTVTEAYDFLRLIFARKGQCFSPKTGRAVLQVDHHFLFDQLARLPHKTRLQILAPVVVKSGLQETLERSLRRGFVRCCLDGQRHEISSLLEQDLTSYEKKKTKLHVVVDRIQTGATAKERVLSSLQLARELGDNVVAFDLGEGKIETYHCGHCDPEDGSSMPALTPQDFAFNHPKGMCNTCSGWGVHSIPYCTLQLRQSTESLRSYLESHLDASLLEKTLAFCKGKGIALQTPLHKIPSQQMDELLWGQKQVITLDQSSTTEPKLQLPSQQKGLFLGAGLYLDLPGGSERTECRSCCGARVSIRARCTYLEGASLEKLCCSPVEQTLQWLEEKEPLLLKDPSEEKVLKEPISQLRQRLEYLKKVGLGYLPLHASAPSMSLGERSRARLAGQLGAKLSDLCYILDEVSCGLHPLDSMQLARSLVEFKNQDNTLLIADHNRHWAQACDRVTELGPSGGSEGGQVCFTGTLAQYQRSKGSLSKALFRSDWKSLISQDPPKKDKSLHYHNVEAHSLKNISLSIPTACTTVICGRSGSGKSSLLHYALHDSAKNHLLSRKKKPLNSTASGSFHFCRVEGLENISGVEMVDSHPIGRSARADVGSYLELLELCRKIYAELPDAKQKGLKSKHFSPNTRSGMCKLCRGLGYQTLDLKYMAPTVTRCSSCQGMRLNHRSLEVRWKGRHYGHLLEMNLFQAKELLGAYPKVARICDAAIDLGLGHLKVGEEIKRLSIGESQRLKLATSLKKRHREKMLFLLDEPTKGLHPQDIPLLQKAFAHLNSLGHTVVAVEHSPELILSCDHLVELGPGSGPDGGNVVYQGTPKGLLDKSFSRYSATKQALIELIG